MQALDVNLNYYFIPTHLLVPKVRTLQGGGECEFDELVNSCSLDKDTCTLD